MNMNKIFSKIFLVFSVFIVLNVAAFSADKFSINIQVGNRSFNGTLADNPSTRALIKKFPMTIVMNDLYSNEKYYRFSDTFPTNQERIDSIKIGDIFLYGSDYLVIFYENFKTSYSYTKLGQVDNPSGFKEALGTGTVQITWSLVPKLTP